MDDPAPDLHEAGDFWSRRCGRFSKQALLVVLVAGFIIQTCLVYSDTFDTVTLDAQGVRGRRIWHRQNCQTCHQLHGFGGFIGPDLTNVVARIDRSQLDTQLTVGSGQMPAFHMSRDQIDAVWAYLTAMNETGIGRCGRTSPR
jgi:nitric oxide reductase subunit C